MTVRADVRNLSEEELVCQAQAGSSASFGVLAERYKGPLLNHLRRRGLQPHDAEDVVQETFVRACANLSAYQRGRPLSAWLFTIATRVAASQYRSSRRHTSAGDPGELADPASVEPVHLAAQDRRDLWSRAAGVLPKNQAAALWLRYGEGRSVRETAAALSLTAIHVKVLLFRARRKLLASPEFVASFGEWPRPGGATNRGVQ